MDEKDDIGRSPNGKEGVYEEDGELKAPSNVIRSAAAARAVWQRLTWNDLKRLEKIERIAGMIDGNPPYNSQRLRASGIGDMSNVNWKDGDAIFKSMALTYWSLFNDVKNILTFTVDFSDVPAQNAEYGMILSEEIDRVIRDWQSFSKHMTFHQTELLQFGLNFIVWTNERDWRFKPVNIRAVKIPDQTQNDIDAITTLGIERKFTAQELWQYYEKAEKNKKGPWDAEAIRQILIQTAQVSDEKRNDSSFWTDLQKKVRNGDLHWNDIYNDDIRLASIFQKEYDGKWTHLMTHPTIETAKCVYFVDRQYKRLGEAVMYFTLSPGQETIHGNKGMGHAVLAAIEAITQLDCSVFDQAKRAGSLLIKGGATRGRDERAVKFVHGSVIDVGEAEVIENGLGSNVGQSVQVAQYFRSKVMQNNNISGHDPAYPDRNVQNAKLAQFQANKEARVTKNEVSHYYEQLDFFFREVLRKMLNSKPGYPGYEYVELWMNRCIKRGVPKKLFEMGKNSLTPEGFPTNFTVSATRSSGSGSQIADQMEMNQMMQIAPTLGERGKEAVKKDFIAAYRGWRFIDRYYPPEDRGQQPVADDTIASLENNQFVDGKQVTVSPDNNHFIHLQNHFRLMKQQMELYQQQGAENTELLLQTDDLFASAGPHSTRHLFYLSQDPLHRSDMEQFRGEWVILANFGDMINNNAAKARVAQQQQLQKQQQELAAINAPDNVERVKAMAEIDRKNRKLEADIQRDRTRDQLKYSLNNLQIREKARLDEMRTINELSIKAAKELHNATPEQA